MNKHKNTSCNLFNTIKVHAVQLFYKFGLNIMIWEISPRLFDSTIKWIIIGQATKKWRNKNNCYTIH